MVNGSSSNWSTVLSSVPGHSSWADFVCSIYQRSIGESLVTFFCLISIGLSVSDEAEK